MHHHSSLILLRLAFPSNSQAISLTRWPTYYWRRYFHPASYITIASPNLPPSPYSTLGLIGNSPPGLAFAIQSPIIREAGCASLLANPLPSPPALQWARESLSTMEHGQLVELLLPRPATDGQANPVGGFRPPGRAMGWLVFLLRQTASHHGDQCLYQVPSPVSKSRRTVTAAR